MLPFQPSCRTTAMGIMPHRDVAAAIDLALTLDVPFWPQLPSVSYFEDMYAQASEGFPGIVVDERREAIWFDSFRFEADLAVYAEVCDSPATFTMSNAYSVTYRQFLRRDLSAFSAIRGQVTGPVSFGFRVVDENRRPIIYDDSIRAVLFEFIQRKVNRQYQELSAVNAGAFVWLDEPGLGWVFNAMSGYPDGAARQDYTDFLAGIEGPKALHLCADINLPYLCSLPLDVLSCDVYQVGPMPGEYARAVGEFMARGGAISWGLIPTDSANRSRETVDSLTGRLLAMWRKVSKHSGLAEEEVARQSLLAPARCCLKNVGKVGASDDSRGGPSTASSSVEEDLVAAAFTDLRAVAATVKGDHR